MLAKREQRSALVITSSVASDFSVPGMAIYGATKAFVRNFGQAVHYEVKDKVDVLSWQAAGVKTKITSSVLTPEERDKMHDDIGYIEPLHAVESAFKDLGHTDNTEGSYIHYLNRILL